MQLHPTATGRRTRLERKRQAVAVAGPVHVTIIDSQSRDDMCDYTVTSAYRTFIGSNLVSVLIQGLPTPLHAKYRHVTYITCEYNVTVRGHLLLV